MEAHPGLIGRIVLAFVVFFRTILDGPLASRVQLALDGAQPQPALPPAAPAAPVATPAPAPAPEAKAPAAPDPHAHHAPMVHMLAILQRGRLVDFLQEDITSFPDGDVGAAARAVHEGCRKELAAYVKFQTVMQQEEGSRVGVPAGFDASTIRLTGNVVGNPPFNGELKHRGWKAVDVSFPAPPKGMDPTIVAAAEVEL